MEYFCRKSYNNDNGGATFTSPERLLILFIKCIFLFNIQIFILYMCTLKIRETQNQYYLYYISCHLYKKNFL